MKTSPPPALLATKKTIDGRLRAIFRAQKRLLLKDEPKLVDLYNQLEEFCLRGGKRLRAHMVILGYKIAGKEPNKDIYTVAAGIEIIHAALLIHDDIIDNDKLRRGLPSFHVAIAEKYNNKKGIFVAKNAANILSSLALKVILSSGFSSDKKVMCAQALGFGSVSTAVGEIMDIVYSHKNVTQKLVETILRLKTARYTVSEPLLLGYLLGGGKQHAQVLHRAGEAFGTAFQIRDDTLGLIGAKSFQSRGGDIRESKPFILAPRIAKTLSKSQKNIVKGIVLKKHVSLNDVEILRQILLQSNLPKFALGLATRYIERAKKEFSQIVNKSLRKEVIQIVDYVITREE